MTKFYLIVKENGVLWANGIRRNKPPVWNKYIPRNFYGWAQVTKTHFDLYLKDWTPFRGRNLA